MKKLAGGSEEEDEDDELAAGAPDSIACVWRRRRRLLSGWTRRRGVGSIMAACFTMAWPWGRSGVVGNEAGKGEMALGFARELLGALLSTHGPCSGSVSSRKKGGRLRRALVAAMVTVRREEGENRRWAG